jgi:hypothetical protein
MKLLPTRVWTREQWERIERGYEAQDMDEKWDVFVENHVAFVHRSWTGRGVFEAAFSPVDGGWQVSAAVTESQGVRSLILSGRRWLTYFGRGIKSGSEHAGNLSAQRDRVLLELVLSAIVLGEPAVGLRAELVRLFMPHDGPAPPEGLIERHLLGQRSHP